jgi:UDP-N-acetylmuramoyl-L-alanyl-D-glutamate--2,6-diaminopimelate ligase
MISSFIKKILPKRVLQKIRPFYHGFLAFTGACVYGFPSKKMIVVGVTGTAGKSSTIQMLSEILNDAGKKAGYITTVGFFDGENEYINKHGLSMPGRFLLQRNLKKILNNGCEVAIVECTSEGLAQNRHKGIEFDIALFTNLAEAHIEAHGGFDNYKKAKGKLFAALSHSKKKALTKKIIGVNADNPFSEYFLSFDADEKFAVSFEGKNLPVNKNFLASGLTEEGSSLKFVLEDKHFEVAILGKFNAYNALLAIAAANTLDVDLERAAKALRAYKGAAGRMQEIENNKNIRLFLDYAPEPVAMKNALIALQNVPHHRIIHVFGSTGGHRDVRKRFEFGKISAGLADIIIITNDDVYDSDPEEIANNVKEGIAEALPKKVSEVLTVLNRKEAIEKSVAIAKEGDIIIFTGKGSEQFLVLPGDQRIAWDEASVIREAAK